MELIISSLALFVSAITGIWTLRHARDQAQAARLANITSIVNIERSLGNVPTALRFHGITKDALAEVGITAEEFAYLLGSCSATSVYHNSSGEDPTRPFAAGSYRYTMCAAADFRRAWPLVKRMMNQGTFVSRMDATIALIEGGRPPA
jgi:hypothetical protein